MTFRERLADWISGGALSGEREATKVYIDACVEKVGEENALWGAMYDIYDATANGKSGTAQKIHRMAKEALGE